MLETSSRLLSLLALLQTRPAWTGAELAERLEVTTRTIRNDIDRLRELGYPVDATRGPAGHYQLGVGAKLPPLLLDDEEAVAVAVGLRTGAGVVGMAESSARALTKLEQVLPHRLRRQVNAIHSTMVEGPGQHRLQRAGSRDRPGGTDRGRGLHPGRALPALRLLGARRRPIRGPGRERSDLPILVEPYRLVSWQRYWYLVAPGRGRRLAHLSRRLDVVADGNRSSLQAAPDAG